jgi:hypothetical protein
MIVVTRSFSVRSGRAGHGLPGGLASFRKFAAPIAAERNRPSADPVFTPARGKAPAVSHGLLGIRFRPFGRVVIPPPAAGANEFRRRGHADPQKAAFARRGLRSFNHHSFALLNRLAPATSYPRRFAEQLRSRRVADNLERVRTDGPPTPFACGVDWQAWNQEPPFSSRSCWSSPSSACSRFSSG